MTAVNPFFVSWDGPFGAPPFDRIRHEHYLPAFEAGMAAQNAEIEVITDSADTPTFENTIEALETTGALLKKVSSVFFNLTSSLTDDDLQTLEAEIAPRLTAHGKSIMLNPALFERVDAVHAGREKAGLGPEQLQLLEETHKSFVRAGARLDDAARAEVQGIDEDISRLTTEFGQNVLKETNAFEMVLDSEDDLAGLPEDVRTAGAEEARVRGHDGKYVFSISRSSITPFLQFSANRELRERILTAYLKCADNGGDTDNNGAAAKIAGLRARRAKQRCQVPHCRPARLALPAWPPPQPPRPLLC